jgi:hypothetical protein
MVHDSLYDSTSRTSDSEAGTQPPHSLSTQLIESGLEVAPASEHDKQFVNHVREGDKEVINQSEKEVVPSNQPGQYAEEPTKPTSRKILGLKRRWSWVLLVALLLAIALGVGLGVGLGSKDSSEGSTTSSASPTSTQAPSPTSVLSDELKIGGSLNASYYSNSGAWNGSGIAQVWQNFAQNFTDTSTANEHEIVVYYQDYEGIFDGCARRRILRRCGNLVRLMLLSWRRMRGIVRRLLLCIGMFMGRIIGMFFVSLHLSSLLEVPKSR